MNEFIVRLKILHSPDLCDCVYTSSFSIPVFISFEHRVMWPDLKLLYICRLVYDELCMLKCSGEDGYEKPN